VSPYRLRAIRHGLWLGVAFVWLLIADQLVSGSIGWDAHAYWGAWHHHLYSAAPEQKDAYLYSPAFAQIIWPLTLIPWPAFVAVWLTAISGAYWWLLKPLPPAWRAPILGLCCLDIFSGNIWSLFAIVIVLGFRFPSLWAVPLLTKVTPVLGPVWFATRREWRALVVWLATVVALVGISAALSPGLWRDWINLLLHPEHYSSATGGNWQPLMYLHGPLMLAVELPIAIGITFYGARTNRPWLLAIAMIFANPVVTSNALVVLAAIPRLLIGRDGRRAPVSGQRLVSPVLAPGLAVHAASRQG